MEGRGTLTAMALAAIAMVAGVYLLIGAIGEGEPWAYAIAAVVVFTVIFSLGAGFVLFVQAVGEGRDARRAMQEQGRFRENTQENLALMGAMVKVQNEQARVQNTQNTMLLRQAREATRMLPPGDGNVLDVDALTASDEIFDSLED